MRMVDHFLGTSYTAGMVGEDITLGAITITSNFLIYIVVYFSTLFGGLSSLMIYNLLAMFGLDEKIGEFGRILISWWTTPPTAEQMAAFEEGIPTGEEDDDMLAAEAEEEASGEI